MHDPKHCRTPAERVKINMPCLTSTDVHDLTRAMPEGAHLELGALPDSVPTARTWARMVWSCWGLAQLAADAAVVLSELTTNAIVHARGEVVDVWTRTDGRRLAVAVGDPCREMPVRADALTADELGGRGLILVDALAAHWGAYRVPLGKVVWAVLGP
jgi:anti-sigma regulatory factor (Ser/Thr protein kinase)